MKEFTFGAWCNFGKCDSGETWIDVELTDEEAEQLVKFGTQPDIYYNGFSRCEELKDLYQKIYDIAVDQMTEELKEFGDLDEDDEEDEEEDEIDTDWRVDDLYACGVNFPNEFEDMLVEEEEDEKTF